MDTLAASLTTHQRGPARRPALSLTLSDSRFGGPRFTWQLLGDAESNDTYPVAAAIGTDGRLHRVSRIDSEIWHDYIQSPGSGNGDFGNAQLIDDTDIDPDANVAITILPIPGNPFGQQEVLLAYVTENAGTYAIKVRSSTNDGSTWSAATTVHSGAEVIRYIALPRRNGVNGDTALFYAAAADDEVWHRRRVSGSWGSATNWNRQSTVESITGLAASHNGDDFIIAVTGYSDTDERPSVWAGRVGDFDFTPDAYTSLQLVIDVDPDSLTQFKNPTIFSTSSHPVVGFCWHETGNVVATRYYVSHPLTFLPNSNSYVQPFPLPSQGLHAAFAYTPDDGTSLPALYLVDIDQLWHSQVFALTDVVGTHDPRLVSAEWSYSAYTTRARFVVDDAGATGELGEIGQSAQAGRDLLLFAGYRSGTAGAEQYGAARRFHIERVEQTFARDGRRTATITASGPWEHAAHWSSPVPQVFAEGDATREEIFQYVAGRAGVQTEGAGGPYWDDTEPSFLLPPNETARAALIRILRPIPAIVQHEGGSFAVDQLEDDTETPAPTEHYCYTAGQGHPILSATLVDQPPPVSWLRVQGPDRYADAVDDDATGRYGPRFDVFRLNPADDDESAQDFSVFALERAQRDWPALRLTVPYHAGQRLWDLVSVHFQPLSVAAYYYVTAIENRYTRRPLAGEYTTTLTLTRAPGYPALEDHEEEEEEEEG